LEKKIIFILMKYKILKVEWKKIAGFRIVVAHSYFKVNLDIIWDIIKNDLPDLKGDIQKIFEEENKLSENNN